MKYAWVLSLLILPFLLLVLLAASIPFTLAIKRWLPDGRLKRLLLRKW